MRIGVFFASDEVVNIIQEIFINNVNIIRQVAALI